MKIKQFLALLLAVLLCLPLAACGKDPDKTDIADTTGGNTPGMTENTLAKNPVTPESTHLAANTLHRVSVISTARPFVQNKATEYVLVVGEGQENAKAASFIQEQIRRASGADLAVIRDAASVSYTPDSKLIVLDCPDLFSWAGLTMPAEDLGRTGYYIKTAGNSVFIATVSDAGAQKGAIAFLRYTIGYEMYADDTIVYANKAETLPDLDVTERPDFEFYVPSNKASSEATYGMNFSSNLFIPVEGETWHNSINYFPKEQYAAAHPDWYSTYGNELCYTAHGNSEELELLAETAAQKMIALADAYPDRPFIALTIEDFNTVCECDACAKIRADYDGANSAAVIQFMNKVNRKVQSALEQQAQENGTEKRRLSLLFFAYLKMEKPPVKNVDGVWQPIDSSVICDEEVGVYIAPIYATYNRSFYAEENTSAKKTIEGWGALTKNIYMWLYETNYTNYLYPLNSYDTMIETYRFCRNNNAVYMFSEGQWNQGNVTCFGKLKEYLNARAMFNVNDSFADITDDFFENYFKDAAGPMRQYFDELQVHLRYLEDTFPEINGNIYNDLDMAKYWQFGTLRHWMGLIDDAYAAIEKYKDSSPELYETLKKHITIESIFPRFAICRLYGGMFSEQEIRQMREDFRSDCKGLSITMYGETKSLDEIYASWGM